MSSLKNTFWNIFARIWAVWVILIFVITMLIFMIPFLLFAYPLSDPKRTIRFISFSRVWMGVFLPLAGTPLRIKGREKFVKDQPYIVVCNHNALLDVPITSPGIPGRGNKTIAKMEMAKIPVFGLLYRTGSVLVDRSSETSRRDSFVKMKDALEMGLHMCIYPEGTRNKTNEPLKSFHDGAFRLALNTGKPIMPAVIFNTRKVMPISKTFYFRPHPLAMHFLDPITPQPGETVESLKQRVFVIMRDYYSTHSARS
ncbi:MAG: 1-acyl-sn-glycerol-3-phosphate acyltransferase [Bacteroidetes bacterium]|nr:1-acyl-sn-glycerol-3-phosphate acyltransferase [Bacteroidota bacterium]